MFESLFRFFQFYLSFVKCTCKMYISQLVCCVCCASLYIIFYFLFKNSIRLTRRRKREIWWGWGWGCKIALTVKKAKTKERVEQGEKNLLLLFFFFVFSFILLFSLSSVSSFNLITDTSGNLSHEVHEVSSLEITCSTCKSDMHVCGSFYSLLLCHLVKFVVDVSGFDCFKLV